VTPQTVIAGLDPAIHAEPTGHFAIGLSAICDIFCGQHFETNLGLGTFQLSDFLHPPFAHENANANNVIASKQPTGTPYEGSRSSMKNSNRPNVLPIFMALTARGAVAFIVAVAVSILIVAVAWRLVRA
jgi:hypothetical protein